LAGARDDVFGNLLGMKCPRISDRFVFADDAKLATQLSWALSAPGVYFPVCDGPRMQRPDHEYEVLRRHNALGRAPSSQAFMAGLSDIAFEALSRSLNSRRNVPCHRISGLLKALRAGQDIVFDERASPFEWVAFQAGHIVVCEEGEEIAQIIAANYAYALDAGLFLIPEVDKAQADDLSRHSTRSTTVNPDSHRRRPRRD
jgi:hypothetical protein